MFFAYEDVLVWVRGRSVGLQKISRTSEWYAHRWQRSADSVRGGPLLTSIRKHKILAICSNAFQSSGELVVVPVVEDVNLGC